MLLHDTLPHIFSSSELNPAGTCTWEYYVCMFAIEAATNGVHTLAIANLYYTTNTDMESGMCLWRLSFWH